MEQDPVRNPQVQEMEEVKVRAEVAQDQAARLAATRAAANAL